MGCSYDTNFKLMASQHAQETNSHSMGIPYARTEFMMVEKMKRTYVKGSKLNPKTIFWAHTGEFQCQKQKSSEFMLEKS